jgi:integrase
MSGKRVARGVYLDRYGYEVRWQDLGRTRSRRFAVDVAVQHLTSFRQRQLKRAEAAHRASAAGSFVRDIVRFLKGRKTRTCYKADRSHLRVWVHRFPRGSRFDIQRSDIEAAVSEWTPRYSPREIRHRVKLLQQFYQWAEPGFRTPCDGVRLPRIVRRKRQPVPATVVQNVARRLLEQEGIGRLRDAKTRARFLILALTGQRPVQLMRTQPRDVDFEARVWSVPPAKGDQGAIIVLNDQMIAAWRLFVAADAWGRYNTRSFSKTLKRNGWPQHVRPYALRHTVAQLLKDRGASLGDIQDQLGHESPSTTTRFYTNPSLERMQANSAKLDGLFDDASVLALPVPRAECTDERA